MTQKHCEVSGRSSWMGSSWCGPPKPSTEGIEAGMMVELTAGALKGEKAIIISISESKNELTMELYDADVPMRLTVQAEGNIRVI